MHFLWQYLHPQQRAFLTHIAQIMADFGWQGYLVGGGVRDLYLAHTRNHIITLPDMDLVLDQAPPQALTQLIPLVTALRPGATVQPHPKFLTCDLHWPDLALDIALARRETYPHPAANPIVAPATIHQDLYRRDFTINAMALALPPGDTLIDPLGGRRDLQKQYLRVLHPHSFRDDPTRLWRGVRYGVRYGLTFAPETLAQWQETLASGVYEFWRQQPGQAPALQTRLRAELHYLWQTRGWIRAGRWLEQLGAWACIHPELHWTRELERTLRYARHGNASPTCLTELLLSYLPAADREAVARCLDVPLGAQKRLRQLDELEAQLPLLPQLSISRICQCLDAYDRELVYGVMWRQRGERQKILWRYLHQWSQQTTPLNGKDLQQMGYRPGPEFRRILSQVRSAFLDREITNRAEAMTYVARHFPRASPGQ
jgi:tRNA nucleotidyltransferase (CCA-adding enzyme)